MPVQDEVPKSRITLTYKTEVNGEPAPVELPFRMMVVGDFSHGTSKDRKVDLSERKVRSFDGSNTNQIMDDMGIQLNTVVANKISPEIEESIRINLNIEGIHSFNPAEVAKQVPQVRSLVLMKKLLEEMQSNIANKKEFVRLLNMVYKDRALMETLKEATKNYAPTLPKKTPGVEQKNENQGDDK